MLLSSHRSRLRRFVAPLVAAFALSACGSDSTTAPDDNDDDPGDDPPAETSNPNSVAFEPTDNDYVSLGTSSTFDLTGAMTLEAWVKCNVTQDNDFNRFIDKMDFVDEQGYNLILNGGRPFFAFFADDGSNHSIFGSTNIQDGQWHHVAGTYDGTTLRIYVDGLVENTEVVGSQTVSLSTNPLTIGSGDDGNGFLPFRGAVDEVRVWNVKRSDSEIAASRDQCLTGTEPGLIGYWRFDEGSGTTVADETANGNDGTFVNTPLWSGNTGFQCD